MIPPQLRSERPLFLKVYPPSADVASPGKQPIGSTVDGPFYHADSLSEWIGDGGNVGRALNDDLVAIDIDTPALADAADDRLPATFAVRTGNGEHRYYRCSEWTTNCELTSGGSIRSDRYLVVVPPSTHPSGQQYEVLHDRPVASSSEDALASLADTETPTRTCARTTPSTRNEGVLSAVDHDERRAELLAILEDADARHHERVWLAGFLNGVVGMGVGEIVRVIERHARWSDYDRETTQRQVRSVVRSRGRSR